MRIGKLFLGILGALGNSYSMLQSTNSGVDKSLPTGGGIRPRPDFDFGFDKLLDEEPCVPEELLAAAAVAVAELPK